jgi:hypothetical protein
VEDLMKVKGRVNIKLFDEHGNVKQDQTVDNLITPQGRRMLLQRAFGTASASAVPTGMKLGNDSTATAIGTTATHAMNASYISGSNKTFDATPTEAVQGNGGRVTMVCSWAADIEEVVVVNDATTNAISTAVNTYARAASGEFAAVNKGASDTLQVTWTWTLGES